MQSTHWAAVTTNTWQLRPTQRPQLRPTDVFEKWQLRPTLRNQNTPIVAKPSSAISITAVEIEGYLFPCIGTWLCQLVFTLGSRFGFCVVSERIQASRCVADRPLAVLKGLAKPDPVTRSGKNKHEGRCLSHTHYELLNLSALEVSFVNKRFHL